MSRTQCLEIFLLQRQRNCEEQLALGQKEIKFKEVPRVQVERSVKSQKNLTRQQELSLPSPKLRRH